MFSLCWGVLTLIALQIQSWGENTFLTPKTGIANEGYLLHSVEPILLSNVDIVDTI